MIATHVISDIHGQYDMFMELLDKIYQRNNHIAIDCGAHYPGGRPAALCLDTGEEYYSTPNEMEETDI